jgi:hypothetical protein
MLCLRLVLLWVKLGPSLRQILIGVTRKADAIVDVTIATRA